MPFRVAILFALVLPTFACSLDLDGDEGASAAALAASTPLEPVDASAPPEPVDASAPPEPVDASPPPEADDASAPSLPDESPED